MKLADGFDVDASFVTARLALVGMSGAGKSNGLSRMIEQTYAIGGLQTHFDPLGAARRCSTAASP